MAGHGASNEGRVAVVTGAGKGLGRAYALKLASKGFAVVVNNRTHPGVPSTAQLLVDEIVSQGGRAIAHGGAVDDPTAAADIIATALGTYGRLDALVCNAGVMPEGPFADFDLEQMRRAIEVNLFGALYPLQPAWRHMLEAGYGRVVLTGSAVGLYGHGTTAVYGATRSAVIGLARSLALEVPAGSDIGVNVILPLAYTAMAAQQMDASQAEVLPAEKVAQVVGWLCDEACKASGRIFHSGGGMVSRVGIVESVSVPIESLEVSAMDLIAENEPLSASQASGRMLTGRPRL